MSEARKGFETRIVTQEGYERDGPASEPPKGMLERTTYHSPAGDLVAYITPRPSDSIRHPAVVWAHGGLGGIGEFLYGPVKPENDQTAAAFREAGLVVMYPSFRGENDNPGRFEMFYGEVDDLLSAVDHVRQLPWVDPARVYLAGHSSGATLVLLAATASENFRAAFAFGPWVGLDEDPASLRAMRIMGSRTVRPRSRRRSTPSFRYHVCRGNPSTDVRDGGGGICASGDATFRPARASGQCALFGLDRRRRRPLRRSLPPHAPRGLANSRRYWTHL